MTTSRCVSCGQENPSSQVYCTQCGVILSRSPQSDGATPLSTSVAVASSRSNRMKVDSQEGGALLSSLWAIIRYLVSVAIGVAAVLALMDPKSQLPDSPQISNASAIVQRSIADATQVQVSIAQQVINQALVQDGRVEWTPPVPFIPVPEWTGSSVILANGRVTFTVTFKFLNYPLHLSETLYLSGNTRQWSLTPESASIGMLPLTGHMSLIVAPFMNHCAAPFARELKMIREADTLRIRTGFLDLSRRP